MSYRIEPHEAVPSAVRRIAQEQVRKALDEIDDEALDLPATIHQVRKRCKKVRGLVRLVRPAAPALYARENAVFRDAARLLSDARDATALLETYDALMEHYADDVDRRAFAPVRGALTRRRNALRDGDSVPDRVAAFRDVLAEAPARIRRWEIPEDGFATIEGGLKKTYKRGYKALRVAYTEPSDEAFHEWRKRAKYHRYHGKLLRALWRPVVNKRRKQMHTLTDYLGDDHDFAVFRQTLAAEPAWFGGIASLQAFLGLIDRRRGELQARAHPLGLRLYAEKPKHLVRRFDAFWDAMKREEREAFALQRPHAVGVAVA